MNKNIKVLFSYDQNGFHVDSWKIIFADHVTEKELKSDLSQIQKLVKSVLKTSNITITVMELADSGMYHAEDKIRYCLDHWMIDNAWTMDFRPYNGHDYSDIHKLNFVKDTDMIKYVIKDIEKYVRQAMEVEPESSLYSQSLNK